VITQSCASIGKKKSREGHERRCRLWGSRIRAILARYWNAKTQKKEKKSAALMNHKSTTAAVSSWGTWQIFFLIDSTLSWLAWVAIFAVW